VKNQTKYETNVTNAIQCDFGSEDRTKHSWGHNDADFRTTTPERCRSRSIHPPDGYVIFVIHLACDVTSVIHAHGLQA
jgi:hypothetical protein